MLNKKGDIPNAILFIGALGLIVLGIFVQLSFRSDVTTDIKSYSELREEMLFKQKLINVVIEDMINEAYSMSVNSYDFDNSFRTNLEKVAERRRKEYGTNLFFKIISKDYIFSKTEDGYLLEIKDIFVKTNFGSNEAIWTFNHTKSLNFSQGL